ncbi:MAG: hypothetical protein A3A44_02705 [Candidatus Sungbacteria bacterium RIFCSPLOWO2_01_FULL_60_25]|uniref:IPT/TIG domain-containing protein n=1 Tax=Candidatus Sungbacteria bacterium RIFCSPLOWO2_01_FULL_60_25 TaxID=1802281 RepID=A0A1G2LDG9_9BACT|nr:MAG: hypothetical protein A3A44_02705 [Candidatus Sungbacteria bacterium RIFCSPLOWO2_01_FULL_60_25]
MRKLQFATASLVLALVFAGTHTLAGAEEPMPLNPEDSAIIQEMAGILAGMRSVLAHVSANFAKAESTPPQSQGKNPATPPGQLKKEENSTSASPTPQPSSQAPAPQTPPPSTSSGQAPAAQPSTGENVEPGGEAPRAAAPAELPTNDASRNETERAEAEIRDLGQRIEAVNERIAKRPPRITALDPASGPLGTVITVRGSGFDAAENKIFIRGHIVIEHLPSSDGATIAFALPGDLACGIGEACPIKVITPLGISNAMPFKITAGFVTPPPPEPTATTTPPVPPQPGEDGRVTVLSPNGGEVWYKNGLPREMRWSTSRVPSNWTATVLLVREPIELGNSLEIITDTVNDGSELWNILKVIPEASNYFITVRVCNQPKTQCHTDTSDSAFSIFTLPPEIVPALLPDGKVSQTYSARIGAREGLPPLEWNVSGGVLPSGLTLTTASGAGQIAGTPTSAGTFTFTARVTDAQSFSDTEEFRITIAAPTPCATDTPRPAGYITYDSCSDQEPVVLRRANGDLVSVFNSGGNNLAVLRGAVSRDQGTTWAIPAFAAQSWDDVALAEGPNGDGSLCPKISGVNQRDSCYFNVFHRNPALCAEIADSRMRQDCQRNYGR